MRKQNPFRVPPFRGSSICWLPQNPGRPPTPSCLSVPGDLVPGVRDRDLLSQPSTRLVSHGTSLVAMAPSIIIQHRLFRIFPTRWMTTSGGIQDLTTSIKYWVVQDLYPVELTTSPRASCEAWSKKCGFRPHGSGDLVGLRPWLPIHTAGGREGAVRRNPTEG